MPSSPFVAYPYAPIVGEDDARLFADGRHARLYEKLGAHPCENAGVKGVAFAVFAPRAKNVSVVGDWDGWSASAHPMRRGPSGIWELFVPELTMGALYKFEITDSSGAKSLKSDPFAFYGELRPRDASVVWDMGAYRWLSDWRAPSRITDPISIYEVHAGSWRRKPDGRFMNWRELAAELIPYVKDMGFTHIELTPVMEHPYDESWGYQPTGLFAPTSRHGTPDDFKHFVDFAHQNRIGVILDFVAAHFPRDAHGLARFDGAPLYEYADPMKAESADWGTLVYDFGRPEVRNFLIAGALFWAREYRVDGLRFDAVASMIYLDYSKPPGRWRPNEEGGVENLEAVSFIKELNAALYKECPHIATYAEESTIMPRVSAPVDAGGLGFGYKWNLGWMHDVLKAFSAPPYDRPARQSGIAHAAGYAFSENFVLPLSHDEVVHMKGSLLDKMCGAREEKFALLRALFSLQWAFPGKKLLFMGGEFAAASEWSESRQLEWGLTLSPKHRGVQRLVERLNRLYRETPALAANDSNPASFRWLDIGAPDGAFAFARGEGAELIAVANLSPAAKYGRRIPAGGDYVEVFSSDAADFGGSGASIDLACSGGTLSLTLPPHSVIMLAKGA